MSFWFLHLSLLKASVVASLLNLATNVYMVIWFTKRVSREADMYWVGFICSRIKLFIQAHWVRCGLAMVWLLSTPGSWAQCSTRWTPRQLRRPTTSPPWPPSSPPSSPSTSAPQSTTPAWLGLPLWPPLLPSFPIMSSTWWPLALIMDTTWRYVLIPSILFSTNSHYLKVNILSGGLNCISWLAWFFLHR